MPEILINILKLSFCCEFHLSIVQYFKDKEETSQWIAAPETIKCILEACMARVSSLKGQTCIVHHKSMYDGVVEKARG